MITSKCRAKDPSTCSFHGAILKMDAALEAKDFVAYDEARRQAEANRLVDDRKRFFGKGKSSVSQENLRERNFVLTDHGVRSRLAAKIEIEKGKLKRINEQLDAGKTTK